MTQYREKNEENPTNSETQETGTALRGGGREDRNRAAGQEREEESAPKSLEQSFRKKGEWSTVSGVIGGPCY